LQFALHQLCVRIAVSPRIAIRTAPVRGLGALGQISEIGGPALSDAI
jgi:hypothetical protein